jgi:hypothetical protein
MLAVVLLAAQPANAAWLTDNDRAKLESLRAAVSKIANKLNQTRFSGRQNSEAQPPQLSRI